jgi:hypothetical protein
MTELDLDTARMDLQTKSKAQIDSDTADTWAARAIAAWEFALAETDPRVRLRWMLDAREYEHEAGEHAGSAGPERLAEILGTIEAHKKALQQNLRSAGSTHQEHIETDEPDELDDSNAGITDETEGE